MLKINLNPEKIKLCNELAKKIAQHTFELIKPNTTIGIERAILRLFNVNGTTNDELKIPLVNVLTDFLQRQDLLKNGAANYFVYLNQYFDQPPEIWIRYLAYPEVAFPDLSYINLNECRRVAIRLASKSLEEIKQVKNKRTYLINKFTEQPTPWLYVIVATGNIYEDMEQAEIAVRQGAEIIAVIRSTAQSLLDYVPDGSTIEGVAGTYATQENFRLMRNKLDEIGTELQRYIRLTNYASGLCMAEMAVLGAIERLDMMLSDSMYGILFRDINMIRTFTDQHFARMIQAKAGIIINTGEDNYLTTSEQSEEMHTVLASQFINHEFAILSGLQDEQIGLGHAFELDPGIENGLFISIADALLCRQCFPNCPLKYMPPTKHVDGNIFKAHLMDALFNLTSVGTKQHIHLVGILSEAIHTPFMHERFLAIQNTKYIFNYAKDFFGEFNLIDNGIVQKRAEETLNKTVLLLEKIQETGLPEFIGLGSFAGIKRNLTGGKGYEGVIRKSEFYFNPFEELILSE